MRKSTRHPDTAFMAGAARALTDSAAGFLRGHRLLICECPGPAYSTNARTNTEVCSSTRPSSWDKVRFPHKERSRFVCAQAGSASGSEATEAFIGPDHPWAASRPDFIDDPRDPRMELLGGTTLNGRVTPDAVGPRGLYSGCRYSPCHGRTPDVSIPAH